MTLTLFFSSVSTHITPPFLFPDQFFKGGLNICKGKNSFLTFFFVGFVCEMCVEFVEDVFVSFGFGFGAGVDSEGASHGSIANGEPVGVEEIQCIAFATDPFGCGD